MAEKLQQILDETECLFTWKLQGRYKRDKLIQKFRSIVNNDECHVPSYMRSWYVRACLAYQLFQARNAEAFDEINQAIEELDETDDRLTQKCMKSCQHILYATRAFMISKCDQDGGWWGVKNLPTLQEAVEIIPPKTAMNEQEKAGLNGFKSYILSAHHGISEAGQGISPLTTSTRLDPSEYEWKISLIAQMIRKRLYMGGKRGNTIPRFLVARPLQMIDDLLKDSELTIDRKIPLLYFKATAETHYVRNRENSPEVVATIEMINDLWREILETDPMNPVHVKYAARWFLENPKGEPTRNEQDRNLVLDAALRLLEKYPKDERCLAVARIVKALPENVIESSETAQRIISRYNNVAYNQ